MGIRGCSIGPGLKKGVIRSKRYEAPRKSSGVPFCQHSQMARRASTTSRSRGPGGSKRTAKRRSWCALTWVPRPRANRPPEAFWRSQAVWASTMGLRGNATAMAVPSCRRSVSTAATARGRKGSCLVSADQRQPKPMASARRASWATARRSMAWTPRSSLRPTGSSILVDREVDLLLRDELQQHGDALLRLLDAALDGGHDVAGLRHALAVAAEGLGHVRVVARDVRAPVLLRGRLHDGQLDGHGEVVEEHGEDGDALAHRRLEVHAREADGRVTPHVDAELVGMRELGAHGEAQAVAELGGLAPADVAERLRAFPEGRDLIARAARVVRDDGAR